MLVILALALTHVPPPATTDELYGALANIVGDIYLSEQVERTGVAASLTFDVRCDNPEQTFAAVLLSVSLGERLVTGSMFHRKSALDATVAPVTVFGAGVPRRVAAAARDAVRVHAGTIGGRSSTSTPPPTALWVELSPAADAPTELRVTLVFADRAERPVFFASVDDDDSLTDPPAL